MLKSLSETGQSLCRRSNFPITGPNGVARGCRSTWSSCVGKPVQSYLSSSTNPFVNLSIEHFLYRKSTHESAVLFIYRNEPCVVIGRNQNPWLELNLQRCLGLSLEKKLSVVRRYSGGGTVYHDMGNVNWTVISPPDTFTRDKHAEMVVRALRACGIGRARVNKRHDIVLDQGAATNRNVDPRDAHQTPWTGADGSDTRKCSGSAYKLTRGRALHHGTCLLNSTKLSELRSILRSPARDFIEAKGVESVSSPVSNSGVLFDTFVAATQKEFGMMYMDASESLTTRTIGEDALQEPIIQDSFNQMQTDEWTFGQTPGFTFKVSEGTALAPLGFAGEQNSNTLPELHIAARHGKIEQCSIRALPIDLKTNSLYGKHTWREMLEGSHNSSLTVQGPGDVGTSLDLLLPIAAVPS